MVMRCGWLSWLGKWIGGIESSGGIVLSGLVIDLSMARFIEIPEKWEQVEFDMEWAGSPVEGYRFEHESGAAVVEIICVREGEFLIRHETDDYGSSDRMYSWEEARVTAELHMIGFLEGRWG